MVGISGPNGVGKTNLLDAIYYLCFTKSYFSRSDVQNALNGSAGFRVEGEMVKKGDPFRIVCILRETGKKEFVVNEEAYDRFARHVGNFPCVFIAPDDVRIITEGSEERRRYIDALLSQLDAEYLQRLIQYNRILQQRNSYLKSLAENRMQDTGLLDVYDVQLAQNGSYIFDKRKHLLNDIIGEVQSFYSQIAGSQEEIVLSYESQLRITGFEQLLRSNRERDRMMQRTTAGIHKDDIQINLAGALFKSIASQGQRKSLLFALKLAEFKMLKESKGFAPILLLDDVFEKLDAGRMHNLLDWVCLKNEGQIFITDTHRERIAKHLQDVGVDFQELLLES